MRLARIAATFIVLTLSGSVVGLAPADEGRFPARGTPRSVREFPAWKLLPTARYATLADRLVGHRRWALYVYRRNAGGLLPQVCLQAITVRGEGKEVSILKAQPECGSARRFVASQSEVAREAAIGVVTQNAETASIKVELVPGGTYARPVKVLSEVQMAKANLPRLLYSVFLSDGAGCLEELTGLDSSGSSTFTTGSRGCDT
jgi:hypothetical protein